MKRSRLARVSKKGSLPESLCKRLDDRLRDRLRLLTHNCCEECGNPVYGFDSQLSHGFTRKIKSLRWDRLNVIHSCAACHWQRNNAPVLTEQTLRRLLGHAGHDELVRRWQQKIHVSQLSVPAIEAYIDHLELGQYPQVSPKPLWELGT